jgi:hypothetical protein
MGLPRDFEMPPRDRFNVLCQNVPVQSARDATKVAMAHLDGQLPVSSEDVMWHDNIAKKVYYGLDKRTSKSAKSNTMADEVFA